MKLLPVTAGGYGHYRLEGVTMAKGAGHGFFCTCKKCLGTSKGGSKPTRLGGSDNNARRDTGGRPAKRQDQKNHGTSRRGGGSTR